MFLIILILAVVIYLSGKNDYKNENYNKNNKPQNEDSIIKNKNNKTEDDDFIMYNMFFRK